MSIIRNDKLWVAICPIPCHFDRATLFFVISTERLILCHFVYGLLPVCKDKMQITGKELRSYIRHLDGIYIAPCLDVNAPTGTLSTERSGFDLRNDQSLPVVV